MARRLLPALLLVACQGGSGSRAAPTPLAALIPRPGSVTATGGMFTLEAGAAVVVGADSAELRGIGQYLVDRLNPPTGLSLTVEVRAPSPASPDPPPPGSILLLLGGDAALGEEGYQLVVDPERVTLTAFRPAGLFRGVQTIRQLLPPAVEAPTLQPGPWSMETGVLRDVPRFPWRGAMLDVSRHFFSVEDVQRFTELMAAYKLNRLHLHLSDDQGWRLEVRSWPDLTAVGGRSEVGGGPGGSFTQAEFSRIVEYARARYITVVPELDMPGHCHAALASYGALTCSGVAPPECTTVAVNPGSLCVGKAAVSTFVDDVVREVTALTPGGVFHVGGDEAYATSSADYVDFVDEVASAVEAHGARLMGWDEIASASALSGTIVQFWRGASQAAGARRAVEKGAELVVSPYDRSYLGSGFDLQRGYSWDPGALVPGIGPEKVLGLEGAIWTEEVSSREELDRAAFPGLCGIAELGWSAAQGRRWDEYRDRLAAHGPRLEAMGVAFQRSALVRWE